VGNFDTKQVGRTVCVGWQYSTLIATVGMGEAVSTESAVSTVVASAAGARVELAESTTIATLSDMNSETAQVGSGDFNGDTASATGTSEFATSGSGSTSFGFSSIVCRCSDGARPRCGAVK